MKLFAEQIQKNWWKWVIVIVVLLWGLYLVWPKYEFDYYKGREVSDMLFIRYNKVTGKAKMIFMSVPGQSVVIDFDKMDCSFQGNTDKK
jgi:hypothetical protein